MWLSARPRACQQSSNRRSPNLAYLAEKSVVRPGTLDHLKRYQALDGAAEETS